jgi:hypothetical protein
MNEKALGLLRKVSTDKGFLASSSDISNYKRIWARDGVICTLAALSSGDKQLIDVGKHTLLNLAEHQHEFGNIPSNIEFQGDIVKLSFGGLAPRVDTLAWFIIGVCQYSYSQDDASFFDRLKPHMLKAFRLMETWEFNFKHLMYVPRSGNWADEYPTQGFTLYDQVLRVWALRSFLYHEHHVDLAQKQEAILNQIQINFKKREDTSEEVYHPKAYSSLKKTKYWVASLEPAGYQTQFDAFGNALALLLGIGSEKDQKELINYSEDLRQEVKLKLLPAFWPVITSEDKEWELLQNNCAYEFRNYPYQFHNGGTWQMINGFYGLALLKANYRDSAETVLRLIKDLNAKKDWKFYENFDSKTGNPNGVPLCAWSAAAEIILEQNLKHNTLIL